LDRVALGVGVEREVGTWTEPSPLQSNGLPFVHPRFTGQGLISDASLLQSGEVVPVDTGVLSGHLRSAMPMGLQMVRFGR